MSPNASEQLRELRSGGTAVVRYFILVLLLIVTLAIIFNIVLAGAAAFSDEVFLPNLSFLAVLGAAYWLNASGRLELAVSIIVGVMLVAAAVPVLRADIPFLNFNLLLLFVPLTLAGLVLGRAALILTATMSLAIVAAKPLLVFNGWLDVPAASADADAVLAAQFALVLVTVAVLVDRFGAAFYRTLQRAAAEETARFATDRVLQETQQALMERQNFNAAILEKLPGFFYVLNRHGRFHQWNRKLVESLGYSPQELRSMNPIDLVAPEHRASLARRLDMARKSGYADAETTFVTRDGRQLHYFVNGISVTLDGQEYVAGMGVDRTDVDEANARVQELNEELVERVERLKALREVDRAINSSLDLNRALGAILEQFTERLKVDAAAVLLFEPDSGVLRSVADRGFTTTDVRSIQVTLGEGLAGSVAQSRQYRLVSGSDELAREYKHYGAIAAEGFEACLCGALVSKDRLVGVIQLFHRSPLELKEDWMAFAATLATQAAMALDNASMVQDLERSNLELRLAYETTISGWARALELKDEETAGHSQRVTDLTIRLAQRIGIKPADLDHIRRGALLHDIGKMGVPDDILRKPGKLDEREWTEMKRHPEYARQLLAQVPFLQPALDIPYSHHEKWDGSGYPLGLKAEEIPLSARIFAVVDVFDALTSDRPYRPAWTFEQAIDYITSNAGAHFDPQVVNAFLELISKEALTGRYDAG